MSRERPHVAVVPPLDPHNPYQRLLYGALERRGVTIEEPDLRSRWLREAGEGVDVVHLHWPEHLYAAAGARPVRAVLAHRRALRAVGSLRALERAPIPAVWTVHNLEPHERRYPWLDRAVTRAALRASDVLLVHSEHAAGRLRERHRELPEVVVVPHGNYVDAYPPPRRPREEVRAAHGVPADAHLLLAFGQVRRYKRIPEAVGAFRAADVAGAHLLVAGQVKEPGLREALEAAAGGDPRVHLELRFVPDEEVAELHGAADAGLLFYDDVFSSGALLLALSLGLPVIAPADTTATEIAAPPAVEPLDGEDMREALARLAAGDRRAQREAALAAARRFGWNGIAETVLGVYERVRRH